MIINNENFKYALFAVSRESNSVIKIVESTTEEALYSISIENTIIRETMIESWIFYLAKKHACGNWEIYKQVN